MNKMKQTTLCTFKENPLMILAYSELLYLSTVEKRQNLQSLIEVVEGTQQDDFKKLIPYYSQILVHLLDFRNRNSKEQVESGGLDISLNTVGIHLCVSSNLHFFLNQKLKSFVTYLKTKKESDTEGDIVISEQNDTETSMKLNLDILYLMVLLGDMNASLLRSIYQELQIEDTLLKLIQLSIHYQFIPIKKVMLLFNLFLRIDLDAQALPKMDSFALNFEIVKNCMDAKPKCNLKNPNFVEMFYQRMITNQIESPLGQIIVVGLLRGLLTTCASSTRSSETDSPGVDIHREWETYYKMMIDHEFKFNWQNSMMESYKLYLDKQPDQQITEEMDRQRVISSMVISDFLLMILDGLRRNCRIQSSYLAQLMQEANGIKVFFKFLLDQFNLTTKLNDIQKNSQDFKSQINCPQIFIFQSKQQENQQISTRQITQLSIKQVLKLMYLTCNNYPETTKEYLLKYNAYVTLKKIPQLFGNDEKIKKYSYLLLKIQINLLNKSQRSKGNNMKMITEAYCKYVPHKKRVDETEQEKQMKCLHLMEKTKDNQMKHDLITSTEDLRKIHLEYNKYHYWKPTPQEELSIGERMIEKYRKKENWDQLLNPDIPKDFQSNYQEWLEENVWDYYD